jgi:plastocyanin
VIGRRVLAAVLGAATVVMLVAVPGSAVVQQVLTWTANDSTTRYASAPATAVAGQTTIVFENSAATGNTTGMPHTLTFDTSEPGYNHDVSLNILANPFDANGGRHEAQVTLTPGRYRYFCAIPGHSTMVGEFTVTSGGSDTTPPEVSAAVSGERNAAGDYLGRATVTVTATDSGSGVDSVEYEVDDTGFRPYTGPVVVSAAGDHSVQYRATDRAGNTSAVESVSFRVVEPDPVDTTPPEVSAAVSGERNAAGEYLGRATVTVTATDSGSGVAVVEYNLDGGPWTSYTEPVVVSRLGAHMVHYRASDVAGNVSPERMVSFTVVEPPVPDTTPPEVSAVVSGERNAAGEYLGRATVTVTATDSGSGVAVVEYNLDGGPWTRYTEPVVVSRLGAHMVHHRASDVAGNTSPEQMASFTVVGSGPDACPDSDTRATVIIDGDDTGVANVDTGDGCTINDLIAEDAAYATHAHFVRHVEQVTEALVVDGVISRRDKGAIVHAAARSDVGY